MDQPCDVCGTDLKVGVLTLPGNVKLNVCVWCHEDEKKFKEWLMREMEIALESSDEFVKLPDGRWQSRV